MALIENTKGRRIGQSPSGYTRLFGVEALGHLMSQVQGTVISAGTELEKLIWERVNRIEDLDKFITATIDDTIEVRREDKIYVASKQQIKKSLIVKSQYEPDFVAFNRHKLTSSVIEVKDGDQFDTKKSSGEHTTLENFTKDISQALPFSARMYLCAFNCETREEIYNGLKHKFPMKELLTGRELCNLLQINYDEIREVRTKDQQGNLGYFVGELLKMNIIWNMIEKQFVDKN
jgi:hypothetical protein